MTNTASALGLGPGAGLAPLKAKWGWIVALGVVYLIAGIIALGSGVMPTIADVYVVGIMLVIAVDLGRRFGPDHPAARNHHPHPLAGVVVVDARNLSRRRSRIRRRELDRGWHGSAPNSLNNEGWRIDELALGLSRSGDPRLAVF